MTIWLVGWFRYRRLPLLPLLPNSLGSKHGSSRARWSFVLLFLLSNVAGNDDYLKSPLYIRQEEEEEEEENRRDMVVEEDVETGRAGEEGEKDGRKGGGGGGDRFTRWLLLLTEKGEEEDQGQGSFPLSRTKISPFFLHPCIL